MNAFPFLYGKKNRQHRAVAVLDMVRLRSEILHGNNREKLGELLRKLALI